MEGAEVPTARLFTERCTRKDDPSSFPDCLIFWMASDEDLDWVLCDFLARCFEKANDSFVELCMEAEQKFHVPFESLVGFVKELSVFGPLIPAEPLVV